MPGEVRRLRAPEIGEWCEQLGLGFHIRPPTGWAEYLLAQVDLDRTWAAFDEGAVVATLRSFATDFTVPGGKQVRCSALTNVTVAPTHRRRGLLTEMTQADLAQSAEKGEVAAILIASEWPIYGRFGYGPAIEAAKYEIDPRAMRFNSPMSGRIELVDDATLHKLAPAVYEQHRLSQPGSIERSQHWWDRRLHQGEIPGDEPDDSRNAIYRSPEGMIEGYLRYRPKQEWDGMVHGGKLSVGELVSITPDAYRALWGFCCSVDLIASVEAGDRAVDEPLPFLVENGRAVRQTARYDFVWVRMLDVPSALAARSYGSEGRIVIEVADSLGYAGGRYLLEGGPDGGQCERTKEPADLSCDVATLGSLYLGGFSTTALAQAGLVRSRDAASIRSADAMFLTARHPWCNTWF